MADDRWATVPLGELLRKHDEVVALAPDAHYQELTVRMWGKGVVLRRRVIGSEIVAQRRAVVRAGQFVLSRIDARNGAFGVVPGELDGAVVSNDFPSFSPDARRLDVEFLAWFSKTSRFVDLCRAASEGTTNRVRLKEDLFLGMPIPLPPIDEQRQIVARLDAIAAKVDEAQRLREAAMVEAEALWQSTTAKLFSNTAWPQMPLSDVCTAVIDNLHSTPRYDGDEFPCVRSQDVGWGTLNYRSALRTSAEEWRERTRRGEPTAGDIVYVREGDVGRCAIVDGSQRFSLGQRVMMFRPDGRTVLPEFLMWQLMSPPVLREQILVSKTGTTSHHVNIKHLKTVRVRVPPREVQRQALGELQLVKSCLDDLRGLQGRTASEIDALTPAVLHAEIGGRL